jgi:hypothetical protein
MSDDNRRLFPETIEKSHRPDQQHHQDPTLPVSISHLEKAIAKRVPFKREAGRTRLESAAFDSPTAGPLSVIN